MAALLLHSGRRPHTRRGTEIKYALVNYYKLDINAIKEKLKNAQESGPNAKPVEIFAIYFLNGKIENLQYIVLRLL